MTKLELKGRLLNLIAQIEDKSNLEDLYRFAHLLLDNEEGSPSKLVPSQSPGPANQERKSENVNDPSPSELPPSKYFSY